MKKRDRHDPRAVFGEAVRKHRLAKGLSQEGLAARAAIHRNYQGGVERGERNVSVINMAKIARALGVPLAELVKGL